MTNRERINKYFRGYCGVKINGRDGIVTVETERDNPERAYAMDIDDWLDEDYPDFLDNLPAEETGKQTPRTPALAVSQVYYLCPNCNRFIERHERSHGNIDIPYCKWCGQKLDWVSLDDNEGRRREEAKKIGNR